MSPLPDEKSGLSPTGPARCARSATLLLVLAGLAVPLRADDWRVEARGLATIQTSLSGSSDDTRGKFKPGLRAEVLAPVVIGTGKPHAIADVVARIAVVDFPQPGATAESVPASAKPAATFALAIERQIGRARLAGDEPAQRVATALGFEGGYASTLGSSTGVGTKWAVGVARLTEERDGLELRVSGGAAQSGAGPWRGAVIAGLAIPLRKAPSWIWVGADAMFLGKGADVVQVWVGAGVR